MLSAALGAFPSTTSSPAHGPPWLLFPLITRREQHLVQPHSEMNLSNSFSFVRVICFLDQLIAPSQESFQECGETLSRIINQSSREIY